MPHLPFSSKEIWTKVFGEHPSEGWWFGMVGTGWALIFSKHQFFSSFSSKSVPSPKQQWRPLPFLPSLSFNSMPWTTAPPPPHLHVPYVGVDVGYIWPTSGAKMCPVLDPAIHLPVKTSTNQNPSITFCWKIGESKPQDFFKLQIFLQQPSEN